ncbi:uncharacterized protein LOC111250294 [Varroa destructor]|uniref:Uncharacterized protein n=1 Tax=Varroa destructor TaxID=109461 RepID=A0A7M7MA34_VARDE|nr:uncharacterized protein LOC111250294 [Varroa destructor]
MWLYSINSTNSVCPRGSSLASDNLYEVDSSPEGSSSSSTSDPYRLFAFPESHSPPTPYETTRQREAARRRQAKVKAGKRQLEQNELQTCDEACRITLFENELSENARQRQACWKPAGKSNAFRTKLSQDRLGGNGKLNKSVEKKNEGLKRKAQRVIAKRRVHRIHNVNQASKDKKKVYCEVEQKLLVNQEIRDLSLKRSSSNTACASLKENVRPTLTLGHQPSKAQDEKKLDQVVTSDNAHKLLLDSDGIDRIFDSVVVMPAMYSTKANSYKADGVFRGLSACAIRKSPLLINSTRRYDGINTTAKTKIRDNVSLFKKRTVNELNSGSTDAVISGNCSNFQLQSRALMNYSPELNTEVRIGNTEQYRSEVNGAEPLLLKHAASPRQVTCDSRLKKPQQRRSQTSNNRFPREVWKGAAVRRERFAQLEGKRVKTERTVSITSIKNSNNQLSVLNKPNGRAIDGHSSDEDAKKTGTDECQSGYDQKEMARRRLVDECTQRDCYVVTARYEEPGGHTSFRHAHAATSTKVDTKQATKAVRDQAVKRSGDSGSVKGNLPKKSRTNAEMLGDSPIQILKVISRTGGAVSKNGKASRKNGNSRPKRPEIDKGRSTALANNISPKAQTTFASSKSSSLKATKTDEGPQNFLSNNDRTSAEIAIVSPKKAPKNSTKPNSASPKMAKAGLKREQTVGKTPPKKSIANPANPLIKQSKRDIKNRSPKKSQLPQDNDGRQPSASYTSILDIDLSNLECSIDETEAGISSEARNLMVKSKPVPKNRHTSQSAFVSFPRISIASLFRRSFSRLEEKHSWSEQKRPSILDEKSCRSCFVQLERIKYERVC